MTDITEFTGILVLMCEWSLTGKKSYHHCFCEEHICVFTGKVILVICWDYCAKGTNVSSCLWGSNWVM